MLRRILRRALRRERDGGYARNICRWCGLSDRTPPVAALTAAFDFPDEPRAHWLRADPVYLHADLNDVLLFPRGVFDAGDLQPLFVRLKAYFEREACTLLSSDDGERWYLRLESAPNLTSVPLDEVAGGSITDALPRGGNQARWRRVMTETQMLLHDPAVTGPRVNSVWFWGEGELPAQTRSSWATLIGDDALLASIAERQGIDFTTVFEDAGLRGSTLIVDRRLQAGHGTGRLQESLHEMESVYFEPLLGHVRRGAELDLLIDDGAYLLTRGRSWQIWK
jgi:hypothetical protein